MKHMGAYAEKMLSELYRSLSDLELAELVARYQRHQLMWALWCGRPYTGQLPRALVDEVERRKARCAARS